MLPLLIIGAGALAVGSVAAAIYASLAADTNSAREAYNRATRAYYTDVEDLRRDVAQAKAEVYQSFDPFKLMHPLYRQSIATADKAYEAKTEINKIISTTNNRLQEMNIKMHEMWNSISSYSSKTEKKMIHQELKQLKAGKQILKQDIENAKNEREAFLDKVLQFNNETHNLKLFIRDNCGHGGRVWYERKFGDRA